MDGTFFFAYDFVHFAMKSRQDPTKVLGFRHQSVSLREVRPARREDPGASGAGDRYRKAGVMLKIHRFACENLEKGCVTDEKTPHFSYSAESDRQGAKLTEATLSVGDWKVMTTEQIAVPYGGPALAPFTDYAAELTVCDDAGETASAGVTFETGRLDTPWSAKWITDGSFSFTEKKVSPVPMVFRKSFEAKGGPITSARIYATALGVYEIALNGKKAGDEYFAPGFTSYKTRLQYQTYDVTELLAAQNEIEVTVAGGWAVGSFVFTRKNRVTADRQALLLELRIVYEDGAVEVIGTDESWEVTEDGPCRMADLYDGETWDAQVDLSKASWRKAAQENLKISPKIYAADGAPVRVWKILEPVSCTKVGDELIYDFAQNCAGVVEFTVQGKAGQVIVIKHAEILKPDGTLNLDFLRSAKATTTYTCRDGEQTYAPKFTYMGFRYISVAGVQEEDITVRVKVLTSDIEETGSFTSSSERLNRLQENIRWGSRSNFMDIPTDCPQRDERMGWTGDIAVFSATACYNYDMSRFLDKWLADVQAEQLPTGGIPNTVPAQGYGFPATMPTMALDFWGDACIMVPWAEYQARGDVRLLEKYYPMMKKYVNACKFWAGLIGFGKKRYIWHTPSALHFGDWVAADVPQMSQWQKRSKWTATASLQHTSGMLADIAEILGKKEDAAKYREMSEKTADAYATVLMDGNGKLVGEEFQTAYVLPLYFGMLSGKAKENAADNLEKLVQKSDYCIGTGFPGTPYILFALADNGKEDTAFKMLFNEKCPSWLYEVKMGATTIWERWDGLDENGNCPIGDDGTETMISYNHYASGAVGDFIYRRVVGLETIEPGFKTFRVKPLVPEQLSYAKGSVDTPYGPAEAEWKTEGTNFRIQIKVPMGSTCELELPDGTKETLASGNYERSCTLGA